MVVGEEYCIWYRKGKLYYSSDVTEKKYFASNLLSPSTSFTSNLKQRLTVNIRIASRILRLQPRTFVRCDEGFSFAYNHAIYIVDKKGQFIEKKEIRPEMRNPLCIAYIDEIPGFSSGLVYGEYGWNDNRGPVSIMQRVNGCWRSSYTFTAGMICHVHALIPCKEEECVYILTGDIDTESGIWKATDDFETVEPVIVGSQQFRSCAAIVENGNFIYATDTPIETNQLYYVNKTGISKNIMPLPGPVINSSIINHNWWFATTVEQNPNLPYLLHCISCKKGPGIKDRKVHIFCRQKDKDVKEIASMVKDFLPMWLFQFGNVIFVNNYRDGRVFINPIAVYKYNQKTVEILWSVEENE